MLLWMIVAATLVPAHQAALRAVGGAWQALLALDAVVVVGAVVVVSDARSWERLAQEDGIIEWSTVFAFVAAAALLVRLVPEARATNKLLAVAAVCIGLFCVFVAGEEISWGQRLLAFKPPDAFLEKNFQQELNLHNLLMDERGLGFELESKHLVATIAFLYGVVGPLLAHVPKLAPAARAFPPLALAPAFLTVVAMELSYGFELAGEGAELLLGLSFVGGLAAQAAPKRVVVWLAAPLVAGVLTAPLFARVLFGADEEGSAAARAELALLGEDLKSGVQEKIDTKKSIHKRVFTAALDGYLDVDGGAFLEGQHSRARKGAGGRADRRGYFLDPWNNPYWIFAQRGAGHVVIYSFGPNRQRDSDVKKSRPVAQGDDLLVVVPRASARGFTGSSAPHSDSSDE